MDAQGIGNQADVIQEVVAGLHNGASGELGRVLAGELLEAVAAGDDDAPVDSARAVGRATAERGEPASYAVRIVFAVGRALMEVLTRRSAFDARIARRLQGLVEEASARAADAHATAAAARRDAWLAYYTHELRNPLNTLVSAIWLLRNGNPSQSAKICEMADRACKKLEATMKEVRELEARFTETPPNRVKPPG